MKFDEYLPILVQLLIIIAGNTIIEPIAMAIGSKFSMLQKE
jgi:hypothetical protein